jgi:hypothetical protein
MITPFKLGLGVIFGTGRQWVSWIALTDLVRAIDHIIKTESLSGPIHLVSPNPVRQEEFAKTLATVLHRKVFLKMPAWLVRLFFGQMGDELLLYSARAVPAKLLASGYAFTYPELRDSLIFLNNR